VTGCDFFDLPRAHFCVKLPFSYKGLLGNLDGTRLLVLDVVGEDSLGHSILSKGIILTKINFPWFLCWFTSG